MQAMREVDKLGAAIEIDAVSKRFRRSGTSIEVLHRVSFAVKPGEIVSILGVSGVGKSTLLSVVAGLTGADEGTVTVDGLANTEARKAGYFGLMPQAPALLPWRSALDNVRLPHQVNRSSITAHVDPEEALSMVGLTDLARAMPRQLSGGQATRVAMARAIASGAPVLLLDEPFASLDELTRAGLHRQLLEIWRKRRSTILLVTHDITEAVLLSDRVVVLRGSPATVAADIAVTFDRPRRDALEKGELRELFENIRTKIGALE